MKIRLNVYPKCLRDFFVTSFLLIMIPVVYYFEMFIVLPIYHVQWSIIYNFHFMVGNIILFNICANLVAIVMCDTSIKGRMLPTDLKTDWKFCSVCESVTPPRSWHCNICNICILKRDHHCMFTSCCIGFENHRYFMVFLLYMLIATLYASFYNMRFIRNFVTFDFSWMSIFKIVFPLATLFMDWTQNQFFIFLIIIVFCGAGLSGALLYFHIDLMLRSVLTHERSTVSKYNKGRLENIQLVLGDKWYLVWLSPWVVSKLPCDGVNWDKFISNKEK